jgi:hypothetical protein
MVGNARSIDCRYFIANSSVFTFESWCVLAQHEHKRLESEDVNYPVILELQLMYSFFCLC